ncbi:hypothetical protein [Catelliglobosispora koreensis]|uniref:hypothetical protein n=1 Tax=Catelliglobosispora koreensis TaxID=129052 RepID=UPI00036298F6|nr:hypothetical protein [Catelliglobosispora koreensis]
MAATPLRAQPRSTVPQQGSRPGGRDVNQATAFVEAEVRELRRRATAVAEPQPEVAEAPRRKLRLAPPVPVSVPRTPFVVFLIVVVIAGVWGILALNTKINENAFKIGDLQKSQNDLNIRQQQLEQFIADKETPGNLAAAAAMLGLSDAGSPAFILLPDGNIIGVPKPAQGTPSNASQP